MNQELIMLKDQLKNGKATQKII